MGAIFIAFMSNICNDCCVQNVTMFCVCNAEMLFVKPKCTLGSSHEQTQKRKLHMQKSTETAPAATTEETTQKDDVPK